MTSLENELRMLALVISYLNQARFFTKQYLSSDCQYNILLRQYESGIPKAQIQSHSASDRKRLYWFE